MIPRFIKPPGLFLFLFAAVPALFLGCAHDSSLGGGEGARVDPFSPLIRACVTGPSALLLTNATGFSAHLTAAEVSGAFTNQVTGQLSGLGPKLLFVPAPEKHRGQTPGGFSFVWDVNTRQGYVLSEALQGFAPISSSVVSTNVVARPVGPKPEMLESQVAIEEEDSIELNDGSRNEFRTWRAPGLNGMTVRMIALTNAPLFTLNLSKIRLEAPRADIFSLPDGFTRYSSAEAMMTELIVRQHNLKRTSPSGIEPLPAYRERR